MQEFFAAGIPGTEGPLCDELRELGFASVRLNRGGIPFRGEWREGWRACLQSRIAQRIQVVMARFPAATEEALYRGVLGIDWGVFLTPDRTLSVSAVCNGSTITHSGFAALKVKDAIVDHCRDYQGQRPCVDRDDADVRVFLHLANDKATVYVDLAGVPLHRRGYRRDAGEAPLRETLAATMLRLSGWDRKSPLLDPLCGAGTLVIEAAMWASGIAPGLARGRFGFERWANFGETQAADLKALCGVLRGERTNPHARITGTDVDPAVLESAQANARSAGVRLAFKQRSALDLQDDGSPRTVVTNPPYGKRLDLDPEFCREFAAVVSRLHGWRVCILAGTPEYERLITARPAHKYPLRNGDLECDFLVYDIA